VDEAPPIVLTRIKVLKFVPYFEVVKIAYLDLS